MDVVLDKTQQLSSSPHINQETARLCVFSDLMTTFNRVSWDCLSTEGRMDEYVDALTTSEMELHQKYMDDLKQAQGTDISLCVLRLQDAFAGVMRRVHADDEKLLMMMPDAGYTRDDAILLQKQGLLTLADLVYTKWQNKAGL